MSKPTEQIWNEFKDKLLAFIIKKVKDNDMANDILQEVFIKIHLKLHSLSNEQKLTSWIYQITRNTILDFYKTKKLYSELNDQLVEFPIESGLNEELAICIAPFLNQLEDKYKEAILATDLGSMSQKEFAQKMSLSYSGAKSRVQRAREQLRVLFNNCCSPVFDIYGNAIEKNECKKSCSCQPSPESFF